MTLPTGWLQIMLLGFFGGLGWCVATTLWGLIHKALAK